MNGVSEVMAYLRQNANKHCVTLAMRTPVLVKVSGVQSFMIFLSFNKVVSAVLLLLSSTSSTNSSNCIAKRSRF